MGDMRGMGDRGSSSRRHRFYADWRLRLRRGDAHGPVCGAGILVTMRHVLTCAHVVGSPDQRIWVEFVESPLIEGVEATVAPGPGSWHPPGAQELGLDAALLVLRTPRPRARPALLSAVLETGQEVVGTGYTEYHESGLTLAARVLGPHGRWVQLDSVTGPVRPGFSGGAVSTLPDGGGPARVVGMTVGRREDDPALPGGEQHSRSYMIPMSELGLDMPLIRELSLPDAWDQGFRRRLRSWFTDPGQPDVKLSAVPAGSGRDRTLRHELYRAHVHYAGGRTDRGEFAEQLAALILPGGGGLDAFQRWLLRGGTPPEIAGKRPVSRVAVAVTALDRDPDPEQLTELLIRVRRLGFRTLITFQEGSGDTWRRARSALLDPTLLDFAGQLVRQLEACERAQDAPASGPGGGHPPDVRGARRYAETLHRMRTGPEHGPEYGPHAGDAARTALLLHLIRAVQRDLLAWSRWP
ncbi:serine protease [Streptomyces sp. NPDC021093]|uniref:serine protease n=1 Tax=Streptomyces sp. NPDC021093 TaxID=3365112 RepID=UPI00378A1C4E